MPDTYQERFHRRWGHLNDLHVRALAWLLDSPDLLDPAAAGWEGRIASLPPRAACEAAAWLSQLDSDPAPLHDYLEIRPFSRLGRYAEKLLAFYFLHRGMLVAHGVQVRAEKNETIGEFDFLLRNGAGLLHWEFATKFYLLHHAGRRPAEAPTADYFVGPSLADTLGAKMGKILNRQLFLSQHPAARAYLPEPVSAAQALVKGWLFYYLGQSAAAGPPGVSPNHCRGFWCEMQHLDRLDAAGFAVLPRLRWMAPAQMPASQAMPLPALKEALAEHFGSESAPVLVAVLAMRDGRAIETDRGFVVPSDWRERADRRAERQADNRGRATGKETG